MLGLPAQTPRAGAGFGTWRGHIHQGSVFWEEMGLSVCWCCCSPGNFPAVLQDFMPCVNSKKHFQPPCPSWPAPTKGQDLIFAFWAAAEGGEICPHELSLPSLISQVQIKSFSPCSHRNRMGENSNPFGSGCCWKSRAEPPVTGTVAPVPVSRVTIEGAA